MDAYQPSPLPSQPPDSPDIPAQWNKLAGAQAQLLHALIELTEQQLACIRNAELDRLRMLLASKQRLADRLAASAAELSTLAAGFAEAALSPAARDAYRQQHAGAIGLYERLFELEREAEQLLVQRRTEAAQRAQSVAAWPDQATAFSLSQPTELRGSRLDLSSTG